MHLKNERTRGQAFAECLSLPVALVCTLSAGELHVWGALQHRDGTVHRDKKWARHTDGLSPFSAKSFWSAVARADGPRGAGKVSASLRPSPREKSNLFG